MRVYLDNCCFNRPFDDQSQPRIRLEAEAKLALQEHLLEKRLTLVWSYMLDYENSSNPIPERRETIARWRTYAISEVEESPEILETARRLAGKGLPAKDALHLACAAIGQCDYFLTTDDLLLKRATRILEIKIVNPAQFVTEVLEC